MATKDKKLITKSGLMKLKKELADRTTKTRKEIADKLDEAKAVGDLSENSAYTAALEEYQFNETRINELNEMINNLKVAPSKEGDAVIDIGDKIEVKEKKSGKKRVYTIVGEQEGDPLKGLVSINSVVGGALLGKKVGETVKVKLPSGEETYTIIKVE